ncbi:hypothetical protein [Anaeromyxobacter oryzae]|uniref:Uncharacterized protein n=1 Tax=Anaeromyxobacter oryzae TaxID=2918170 RepID=A0ABN6MN38_9BACT|nr:hypothetical protein [Anaeromyxobacter oryzae]BDG02462.1 hypothetical protein AMOR_14580 [Anaeromyxobacter oryzae]
MSDLPAAALGYQAVVTEYFLALRGAGLLVSPLDEELVLEWERRGLPVAVVCQGLKDGMAALAARNAGAPRSIRSLRLAVEDAWRAYRAGRVGDAPPPPGEEAAAAARLAAARALLADAGREARGPLRDAYRDAWRAVAAAPGRPGSPLERLETALAEADDRLLAGWLACLPRPERAALGPRLRLLAGPRERGTSARAHREALRHHLHDAARRAGLTCLRGSV